MPLARNVHISMSCVQEEFLQAPLSLCAKRIWRTHCAQCTQTASKAFAVALALQRSVAEAKAPADALDVILHEHPAVHESSDASALSNALAAVMQSLPHEHAAKCSYAAHADAGCYFEQLPGTR